jgi:hypothetical protein
VFLKKATPEEKTGANHARREEIRPVHSITAQLFS